MVVFLRLGQHKPRSREKPHELPEEWQAVVPTAQAVLVHSNDHLSESQRVHLNPGGAGIIGRVKVAAQSAAGPAGPHSLLQLGHNFQDVKRQGSKHAIGKDHQIFPPSFMVGHLVAEQVRGNEILPIAGPQEAGNIWQKGTRWHESWLFNHKTVIMSLAALTLRGFTLLCPDWSLSNADSKHVPEPMYR
jgi:hypothetical protein